MSQQHPVHWFKRLCLTILREPQDLGQLIQLLKEAKHNHLIDGPALAMIEGVLTVSDTEVKEIMVPRPRMVMLQADTLIAEALPTIIESGHSRFPILTANHEQVAGILLAKDCLHLCAQEQTSTPVSSLARKALFTPESKRLDGLLREFQQSRQHMSIAIDEYGNVSGLITIEDVLEQIVGDIDDETDLPSAPSIEQISDLQYQVPAQTSLDEFNEYFNTDLSHPTYETIAGVVLGHFHHIPKPGDQLKLGDLHIEVLKANKRAIKLLKITRKLQHDPNDH